MAQKHNQPEDVVVGFYSLVNDKNFDDAFACLTPNFRENHKIWKGDVGVFKGGYQFLIATPKPSIKYELTLSLIHI